LLCADSGSAFSKQKFFYSTWRSYDNVSARRKKSLNILSRRRLRRGNQEKRGWMFSEVAIGVFWD
jgi:hypothetical protein